MCLKNKKKLFIAIKFFILFLANHVVFKMNILDIAFLFDHQ